MSWDFSSFQNNNYNNTDFIIDNKNDLPLHSEIPFPETTNSGSISSVSSNESNGSRNIGATDYLNETQAESKHFASIWNQPTSKLNNTLNESHFSQNQLGGAGTSNDSWYSSNISTPSGYSQQHVPLLSQPNDYFLHHNYAPVSTPISSSSGQSISLGASSQQLSQPQFPENGVHGMNHIVNNTQSLLQNFQQQQLHLENLQTQQTILQNPLLLQKQAQLVSQQLQQLQIQLQFQQKQLESTAQLLSTTTKPDPNVQNNSNIDLPSLTTENLTKLSDSNKILNAGPKLDQSTESLSENSNSEKPQNINTELYKTELCSTFAKNGNCPYGSKCQFAHGTGELKLINRGTKWRSKPCANWAKDGNCRYGNRCCFRHGD